MPNLKNTDKEIDILLKIYEANRAAIIARVGFRDNALMIFLGGVATIFGAAIQTNNYAFWKMVFTFAAMQMNMPMLNACAKCIYN